MTRDTPCPDCLFADAAVLPCEPSACGMSECPLEDVRPCVGCGREVTVRRQALPLCKVCEAMERR